MPSQATVEAYAAILEDDETADVSGDEIKYTVALEDIAETQDELFNDSSDSDNEVVLTAQLRQRPRPHPQAKPRRKKFDNIAVLLRRKYRKVDGRLFDNGRRLEIQSPALIEDLRELLMDGSDDINWDENPVKIYPPYCSLFFNRQAIEDFVSHDGETEGSARSGTAEMRLIHDFIHKDEGLKPILKRYDECVPNGLIKFDMLWTIFAPNALLLHTSGDILECYRCDSAELEESHERAYSVYVERGDFDGIQACKTVTEFRIPDFEGTRKIESLPLVPLDGHPDRENIMDFLRKRHDRFQSIIASKSAPQHYQGHVWTQVQDPGESMPKKKFHMTGRVVIDHGAYLEHFAGSESILSGVPLGTPGESGGLELLCPAYVPGFVLADQRAGWFLVDEPYLTDIKWKPDPFQHLVLEEHKKILLEHLVMGHMKGGNVDFDDIVAGKGRGLVLLLRGSPGLGKTLMAECLSEHARMPLYKVAAGELTMDISKLETSLKMLFDLGKRWKALLLLDEADVLMHARKVGELETNSIVAAFLRVLEYYEGILFLTTNKPDDFDEAIKDRIHLELTFEPLSQAARRVIWESTLGRVSGLNWSREPWISEMLDELSELSVNGRQIKNYMRLATCFASGEDIPMNPRHLVHVIQVKHPSSQTGECFNRLVSDPANSVQGVRERREMEEKQELARAWGELPFPGGADECLA